MTSSFLIATILQSQALSSKMKNIQLFKPKYRKEEILKEISECFDLGWTGLGFKTSIFEEKFKEYSGFKYAHMVASNTSGLEMVFHILKDVNKWRDGDEIITTPLTFVSSNHSIVRNKLKPVFADVDESLCLDLESVETKITKRTKAVLFVGVGGNIGQLIEIQNFCKKNNLKFILDAAHMAGTKIQRTYDGVAQSYCQAGYGCDAVVFSFQSVKNLPTADSGMVCFNNHDYDLLIRKLSWLGIDKDTFKRTSEKGSYKWDYDVIDFGYKSHGNSIMASMGIVALKYLDEDNSRRREISEIYDSCFEDSELIIPIKHSEGCQSSRHLYQVRVRDRERVFDYLNNHGIYPGVHYKDNTEYGLYSHGRGTCPNSHSISKQIISLPLHLFLTDSDVDYVATKLKEACSL